MLVKSVAVAAAEAGKKSQVQSRVIKDQRPGLSFERYFTRQGVDPFDTVEWERRDAVISGADGRIFFEQRGVEFPKSWSQTATNVVVQKYFRGTPGTPGREHSVKQMIGRVADTIYTWGKTDGYLRPTRTRGRAEEEAPTCLHQKRRSTRRSGSTSGSRASRSVGVLHQCGEDSMSSEGRQQPRVR